MAKKRIILLIIACMMACSNLRGQDIHFSQIDINPTMYNPAYSGFFDGNGRIGIDYRNQWASVSEPFQTFSANAEVALLRNRKHRFGINAGVFAYADHAGSLDYGTSAGDIILSAYHGLSGRANDLFSIAAAFGCGQAGFNESNANMGETESFNHNEVFFTNISAGIAYFHQFDDLVYAKFGVSGQHLNRPNISYLGVADTYLERKFNGYARLSWEVSTTMALMPVAAVQFQKQYQELIYGMDVKWYCEESIDHQINLIGGLMIRQGDALIADFGIDYNAMTLSFSYDANISKLASASHTIGAFEVGLVYRFTNSPNNRRKALSCPVF